MVVVRTIEKVWFMGCYSPECAYKVYNFRFPESGGRGGHTAFILCNMTVLTQAPRLCPVSKVQLIVIGLGLFLLQCRVSQLS